MQNSMCDFTNEIRTSYEVNYMKSRPYYSQEIKQISQDFKPSKRDLDQKDYWMVQYKLNHDTKRQNTVYVCKFPGCGKEFKKKWNYTEHFKAHTQEKPYQCPECGKFFSQKGSMVKHIKARSQDGKDHGLSKLQELLSKKSSE